MDRIQIVGKSKSILNPPGIILINPKYSHNVAQVLRIASCFGIENVVFTGNRVMMDLEDKKRLPREERMKGYGEVNLINSDYPFDLFNNPVPVAIELKDGSRNLVDFLHPYYNKGVYVFGSEDGGLDGSIYRHCHYFVTIPSRHCFNLSMAVGITLYDRMVKNYNNGDQDLPILSEQRGFIEPVLYD